MAKEINLRFSREQAAFYADWESKYQVAVGAIRSGKTFIQVHKMRHWFFSVAEKGVDGILSGKAGDTIVRNVLKPFAELVHELGQARYFKFKDQPRTLTFVPKNVTLWVLGGNDEGAWERVMGMTSQVFFGDELTLQPESFVMKCIERTSAGGRFKVWTTNNDAPTHWLKTKYIDNYRLKDILKEYRFSIANNPTLSKDYIAELYATHFGVQRERYLEGKWAADTQTLIIPEIHEKESEVVREHTRPKHCHKIVAMDPGFEDYCAVIFGYYDFEEGLGVVEETLFLRGKNSQEIADEVRGKEKALWGGERPYGRYSDSDKILLSDLSRIHGIHFSVAKKGKGNKASKVNKVRAMIGRGELVILPKNEKLIYQLKTGQWAPLSSTAKNDQARNFIRTKEEGHFDGIDALGDFCRYLPVNKMTVDPGPVPRGMWDTDERGVSTQFGDFTKLFGRGHVLRSGRVA